MNKTILILYLILTAMIVTIQNTMQNHNIEDVLKNKKDEQKIRVFMAGSYRSKIFQSIENNSKTRWFSVLAGETSNIHIAYEIIPLNRTVTGPSQSTWVKVYGYVGIKTSKGFHPFERLYVEAWDRDSDGTVDFLGATYTNNTGYFEMEFDNTDGWLGAYGNQDIYLVFYLNTTNVIILRNGEIYKAQMLDDCSEGGLAEYGIDSDGKALSLYLTDANGNGIIDIDNDTENEAVLSTDGKVVRYIFEDIPYNRTVVFDTNGNFYIDDPKPSAAALIILYIDLMVDFLNNTLSISPSQIKVEFSNEYGNTHYDYIDDILYVSGHPSEMDWKDIDPILKEYAKMILDKYAGVPVSISSGNYTWDAHQDEGTAWIEGFATFLQSVFKQYYGYTNFTRYNDTLNGVPKYDADLEAQYDEDRSRNDQDVIGAVAGLLWDFYDDVSDDQDGDGIGDSLNFSLQQIWNVVVKYKPQSVLDFIWAMISEYNLNETVVWELCWEHGINIDNTPPTRPSIDFWLPTMGVWINQSWIWINWTYSSDDISLMSKYKVCLISAYDGTIRRNITVSREYNRKNISVGSGKWRIMVVAVDRAGNENASNIVGDFLIDVDPPIYSDLSYSDGYVLYDNYTGAIFLNVSWKDQHSGVNEVYIRYKIGSDGEWTPWIIPANDSGRYYVSIDLSEWKNASVWNGSSRITIYWESYCVDVAGNRASTGVLRIIVEDDDYNAPMVVFPESAVIIYDYQYDMYVVGVNITDESGLYNITFVVWFEAYYSIIYDMSSIRSNGTYYYIEISRDVWIGYVGCKVYLEIYVVDNDTDRDQDRMSYYGKVEYGEIRDDDPDAPVIWNITIVEIPSGDGLIETDEQFTIIFYVNESSGILNFTFNISLGGITIRPNVSITFKDNVYVFESEIIGPLEAGEWNVTIVIWDNDSDRSSDSLYATNSFILRVLKEKLKFTISETEIVLNYTESFNLSFIAYRDDGGVISLNDTEIVIFIQEKGVILHPNVTILNETHIVGYYVISPEKMGIANGVYTLILKTANQTYIGYESDNVYLYVWMETYLVMNLSNTNVSYGETLVITINLSNSKGDPANGVFVEAKIIGPDNSTIYVGGNYTQDGIAKIYWKVNVSEGNYTLTAFFDGSSQCLYSSSDSKEIVVRKATLLINLAKSSYIVYSDGGRIIIYVTDEHGNRIQGVNITLYIYYEGSWLLLGSNITDKNGTFVLVLSTMTGFVYPPDLLPGEYICRIVALNLENYYDVDLNKTIKILKENIDSIEIYVNASYVEWGDGLSLEIVALDDEGNPVVEANVSVLLELENGTRIEVTNVAMLNGSLDICLDLSMIVPTQRVKIIVNITSDKYNNKMASETIYVIKEKVFILHQEHEYVVVYNESLNITIRIIDDDGEIPLGCGTVKILVDDVFVLSYDIRQYLHILYPFETIDLMPGPHTIKFVLSSDYYELFNATIITLIIEPIGSELSILSEENITVEYGDNFTVIVSMTSIYGDPIAHSDIIISIITDDGEEIIGRSTTNTSGIAIVESIVNILPGEYLIRIRAIPPSEYASIEKYISIIVEKEEINIEYSISGTAEIGEEVYIDVEVVDDDGDPVEGVKVQIFIDDHLVSNATYMGERIRITWIPDTGGKHKIKIMALDSEYYTSCSIEEIIEVDGHFSQSMGWIPILLAAIIILVAGVFLIIRKRFGSPQIEHIEEDLEVELDAL